MVFAIFSIKSRTFVRLLNLVDRLARLQSRPANVTSRFSFRYGFTYNEIAEIAMTTIVTMILHFVFMSFPINDVRRLRLGDAYYAIASSAFARFATVRSMLCSLSRPNSPTRKVLKSGRSSHCSGTPAAVCRPTAANFFDDWMPSSVV